MLATSETQILMLVLIIQVWSTILYILKSVDPCATAFRKCGNLKRGPALKK